MPSNTANGLRIPLDTDPLADAAKAMRDLANGIQSGQVTVDIVTQNVVVGPVNIVFPVPYPAGTQPVVTVTCNTTGAGTRHATVGGITNTGFGLYAVNQASSADVIVNWIAV